MGLTLKHLNSNCESPSVIAGETVAARLAPFVVPKDTPGWQALAIRSANLLEAWAKSIREYGNLPPSQTTHSFDNSPIEGTPGAVFARESKTPSLEGHTTSNVRQSTEDADSTPDEDESKSIEQKQQINWIDQIDDPLLKPRESDELFAQMFDNIGKQ